MFHRPNSAASSRASARQRKPAFVDDSLFKTDRKTGKENDTAVVNMADIRNIRGKAEQNKDPMSAVITAADLARIRATTRIVSKEQAKTNHQIQKEQVFQERASARARIDRQKAADAVRKHKLPPTYMEAEVAEVNETLLTKAQHMLDEEHDDVKKMNQHVLYSKVVTIRDKQLIESKGLEEEWLKEQKKLDLMMEIERLKDLQEQEQRAIRRKEQAYRGAKVITDQIQGNQEIRMKEQEVREKEKLQLLANIERQKVEEDRKAGVKRELVTKMFSEMDVSNKHGLALKEKKKQDERVLEQNILDYQRNKTAAEEAKIQAAKRLAEEKEREIQKLRELQERAADRQAEIDGLRAKRSAEENERKARNKERAEKVHQSQVIKELEVARIKQFNDKEERLAFMAKVERDEFLRLVERQKAEEEEERRLNEQKLEACRRHADCIRTQMGSNMEKKKVERLDYIEEGNKTRQAINDERLKVQKIRQQKISHIEDMGIDPKYQYELKTQKISF